MTVVGDGRDGAVVATIRGFLRVVLEAGLFLVDLCLWVLATISPAAIKRLEGGAERALNLLRRRRFIRPQVIALRVSDTSFQLCLCADREAAPRFFTRLRGSGGGSGTGERDSIGLVRHLAYVAQSGEVYEPVATACLTRLLSRMKEPSFMDIGAFMGYFSCYVSALLGNRRDVYAVESNPLFCEAIWQSARLNGFSRLRVLNAVLAEHDQEVIVQDTAVVPPGASGRLQGQLARTVALDRLCAREGIRPNILKIDVDGAEGRVLLGMQSLLRECVQFVLLELHTLDLLSRFSPGLSRPALLAGLEGCGFSCFYIEGHRYETHGDLRRFLCPDGFAYHPLNTDTAEYLLFDRVRDVLVLASKDADVERFLGGSCRPA